MEGNNKRVAEAENLLDLISPLVLEELIKKYKADFSCSKLHTEVFLKLFLYCKFLDQGDISLRSIATCSESQAFKQAAHLKDGFSVGKSGLSDRLSKIPWELFQELFENLARKALMALPKNEQTNPVLTNILNNARILDSTIITLSAKLLKAGFVMNENSLNLKASISISGNQIPIKALLFTEELYCSEDMALPKLMDLSIKNIIYIFDRGIMKYSTYMDIAKSGNFFVTRLKSKSKYKVLKANPLSNSSTETLTILSDEEIAFARLPEGEDNHFRLITATSKKDGQTLLFLTNIKGDIEAADITEIYRCRWSIEIFFRFLKCELNLESLLSYSENGAKAHIYLTLISFILTWIYKESMGIKSFKRAREKLGWFLLDKLLEMKFQEGIRLGARLNQPALPGG